MTPAHPALIFGSGNVGASWGGPATTAAGLPGTLTALKRLGISRIDTAAVYPPGGTAGDSERLLGEAGAAAAGFVIDTKVAWDVSSGSPATGSAAGSLQAAKVRESAAGSVARLRAAANVLYAHMPDTETPMAEAVEAFEEERRRGSCKETGVSNFTPAQVEEWVSICKQKGYKIPAVYQGSYSLVFRAEEETLFPVLRRHGIAFFAYSPLASGFLNGKLTSGTLDETSRFADQTWIGEMVRGMLDKAELHAAVTTLQGLAGKHGISLTGTALRWIAYHSRLRADLGDGIILGASRIQQLEDNVADVSAGPLPVDVVEGIEEIWRQLSKAAQAKA